jgi:hypothetical protein
VTEQPDAAAQRRAGCARRVLAVSDVAGGRIQERRGDRQERGLSGAVRSKERQNLAGLAAERNFVKRAPPAEITGDVSERDSREVYAAASSSISAYVRSRAATSSRRRVA